MPISVHVVSSKALTPFTTMESYWQKVNTRTDDYLLAVTNDSNNLRLVGLGPSPIVEDDVALFGYLSADKNYRVKVGWFDKSFDSFSDFLRVILKEVGAQSPLLHAFTENLAIDLIVGPAPAKALYTLLKNNKHLVKASKMCLPVFLKNYQTLLDLLKLAAQNKAYLMVI